MGSKETAKAVIGDAIRAAQKAGDVDRCKALADAYYWVANAENRFQPQG